MYDGEMLKYGCTNPIGKTAVPVAMASTQVLTAASGRLVYMNDGAATLCDSTGAYIFGGLESEAETPSTGEIKNCIIDLTAIFRLPIAAGTYVVGMQGDMADIEINSSVQGVELDDSTQNLVFVVDGDATNSKWVDVVMNPAVWGVGIGVEV